MCPCTADEREPERNMTDDSNQRSFDDAPPTTGQTSVEWLDSWLQLADEALKDPHRGHLRARSWNRIAADSTVARLLRSEPSSGLAAARRLLG